MATWITIDEAAARSGQSAGHIRRRAAEWLAAGKSRIVEGGGRRRRYEVTEEADEGGAFARVKFADQIGKDLRAYSETQRKTAADRKRLLDKWSEAKRAGFSLGFSEPQTTAQFLVKLQADEGRKLSRATLFNWQNRYRAEGLEGLIDSRGIRPDAAGSSGTADPFLEEVKRLYLSPRNLKLTVCHEIAMLGAKERGWEIRSYAKAKRAIAALPKALVLLKRGGEEAYVDEAEPYIERDYSTLASNEQWVADHHQFDVICQHGGKLIRPWLTAWMDMRSRFIVGWTIYGHDPNGDTVLAAFRLGVLANGLPDLVYLDNGKDFDSYALKGQTKKERLAAKAHPSEKDWRGRFKPHRCRLGLDEKHAGGIFGALEIKSRFCWAYHGQSKPIERFFNTVEMATPVWPTYCGRSAAHKPEDLNLQVERGHSPQLAEFVDWWRQWLDTYHSCIHTGDSMDEEPRKVYSRCLHTKRTASEELINELLLPPTKPIKVGQNGVTYKGIKYGQYDTALRDHFGREVILKVDPANMGLVRVYDLQGNFVCVSTANMRIAANASAQELREAIAMKNADRKKVREFYQHRTRLTEDLPDKIIRARMATAAANARPDDEPSPPPTITPLRHPLEEQLPAIRRAVEFASVKQLGATGTEDARADSRFIAPAVNWRGEDE